MVQIMAFYGSVMAAMLMVASGASMVSMVTPGFDDSQLAAATVVPDWLDSYDSSSQRVDVELSFKLDTNTTRIVGLGELLLKNETQSRPHVELRVSPESSRDGRLFTLVSVDPDVPFPWAPTIRNVLHWIVSNIPAPTSSDGDDQEIWEAGVENVVYEGPAPPEGTHRYYFLVFEQESQVNITTVSNRINFSVRDFAREYDLYYPIGGTFFEVSADS